MIKIFLAVILAVLLIGGGIGGYLAIDRLYLSKERETKKAAEEPVPIPVDPSKEAWSILSRNLDQNPEAALQQLRGFLADHPETPLRAEVLDRVNQESARLLFTPIPASWKEPYTVVSGDSLSRIATRSGAPMDWILKMNNLPSHDLSVGQQLLVPKLDVRLVLSLPEARLFVFQENDLLFAFPVEIPVGTNVSRGEGTVTEKIASGSRGRVAFADREYPGAEKSIPVSLPGVEFAAMPDPAPDGETPAIPRGILLSTPDMEELFLLVKRGTPVLIQ